MSRYRSLGLTREPFAPEPDLAFQSPALGQTDALTRVKLQIGLIQKCTVTERQTGFIQCN